MSIFQTLKQDATNFLEPYKTKEPATYAAAEQAIGAILITDGFVGLENPFGTKKRPGIFGSLLGIVLGVVFIFIPTIFGNLTGISKMTASTTGTVVSIGQPAYTTDSNGNRNSGTCALTTSYTVNGQEYTSQSAISSGDNCSLAQGQQIAINYNPSSPNAWAYGAERLGMFMQVFRWAGVLAVLSSIITFFIRLFSIIFGWKLVQDGRRNAANLPPGTNLQTMIAEIKKNFISSVFGFGAGQGQAAPTPQPAPLQNL